MNAKAIEILKTLKANKTVRTTIEIEGNKHRVTRYGDFAKMTVAGKVWVFCLEQHHPAKPATWKLADHQQ